MRTPRQCSTYRTVRTYVYAYDVCNFELSTWKRNSTYKNPVWSPSQAPPLKTCAHVYRWLLLSEESHEFTNTNINLRWDETLYAAVGNYCSYTLRNVWKPGLILLSAALLEIETELTAVLLANLLNERVEMCRQEGLGRTLCARSFLILAAAGALYISSNLAQGERIFILEVM